MQEGGTPISVVSTNNQQENPVNMLGMYMAHDIEPALVSFRSFLKLVKEGKYDPNKKSHQALLVSCDASVLLAQTIVQDLLTMAKRDQPLFALDMESVVLKKVIDEALAFVHPFTVEKSIVLKNNTSLDALNVKADNALLRRVLVNLLLNSVKHTLKSGCISVETRSVEGGVSIDIVDDGVGIPEDVNLDDIFDSVKHIRLRSEKKIVGYGFGLPFCKKVVGLMGGTIHAKRGESSGMVFTVTLNGE